MLKRSKYSRLRDESLTSLEDLPQRMFSLKREFGLDSDFALLDPRTPAHQRPSSLRDFLPRVANIRLQSPGSPRGQMFTSRDQNTERNTNRPLSRTEWDLVPHQRFCSLPSFSESLLTGQSHSALNCPKRPITLHRMAGLPWKHSCPSCMLHRDGLCCLKTSAADELTGVLRANRAVHYDIKVPVAAWFCTHTSANFNQECVWGSFKVPLKKGWLHLDAKPLYLMPCMLASTQLKYSLNSYIWHRAEHGTRV